MSEDAKHDADAKHVKSKRGYGEYEIAIGGNAEAGEGDIFTYDVNKDESGGDVIVNFENLRDSEAKASK